MGFRKRMVYQCRKPRGIFGKFIAKGMNKGHAKMAAWGKKFINVNPNHKILDIGCGGGINIYNFALKLDKGKVYGIDYSDISVQMSKKQNMDFIKSGKVDIQKASVSELPFPDLFFDLVTGFETYYFWPDLINDLKEILRVLKIGGTLLLVNEAFKCENPKLRKRNEGWSKLGSFPIHSHSEIKNFLEKAGFSNVEIKVEKQEEYIVAIGNKL